jgi:hypothetical protein
MSAADCVEFAARQADALFLMQKCRIGTIDGRSSRHKEADEGKKIADVIKKLPDIHGSQP